MQYDLRVETIRFAAERKFCVARHDTVEVSAPYWVDPENDTVRVGVMLNGDISFGANYNYLKQEFE